MLFTPRKITGLCFLICLFGMACVFYFQFVKHLSPCPLCIMQRIGLIGAGLFYLIAFLHNPKKKGLVIYAIIALIFTLFGLGVALRQVYLQHLPPGMAPACGPGFNYLFQSLPLSKFIMAVLKGTGDCAIVHYKFLGLSLAGLSGIAFLVLSFFNIALLCLNPHKKVKQHVDDNN